MRLKAFLQQRAFEFNWERFDRDCLRTEHRRMVAKLASLKSLECMSTEHRHFGIIPDGGRRWAKREGRSLIDAYSCSVSRILELAHMAYDAAYDEVSVYCLSLANLDRPKAEVDAVLETLRACLHQVEDFAAGDTFQYVRVIGELERLPGDLQQRFAEMSRDRSGPALNLLVAYDARLELHRAQQRAGSTPVELHHFDVQTPLQVIFRSAQGNLLSGFLPFQSPTAVLTAAARRSWTLAWPV